MASSLAFGLVCLLTSSDPIDCASLTRLSSPHFRTREAGSRHLAGQMPRVRLLLDVATSSRDPEVVRRCQHITEGWQPSLVYQLNWWIAAAPRRWPQFDMIDPNRFPLWIAPPPMPDMMGYPCRRTLFEAFWDTEHILPDTGPDYQSWRSASVRYSYALMLRGYPPSVARDWIEGMWPVEHEWYRSIQRIPPP